MKTTEQLCEELKARLAEDPSARIVIADGEIIASGLPGKRVGNKGRKRKEEFKLDFSFEAQVKLMLAIRECWEDKDTAITSVDLVAALRLHGYPKMSGQSLAKLMADNVVIHKACNGKQKGQKLQKSKPRFYVTSPFKKVWAMLDSMGETI